MVTPRSVIIVHSAGELDDRGVNGQPETLRLLLFS